MAASTRGSSCYVLTEPAHGSRQTAGKRNFENIRRTKADKTRPPVIAPAPLPSIPGTLCAPALAAQIIVDKFEDHLPHYRQSNRFRRRYDVDTRIRRKFVEAKDLAHDITLPILLLIQRIYRIENETRKTHAPPACRTMRPPNKPPS